MRVEPSQGMTPAKKPHRLISGVGKFLYTIVRIPFRISLRVLFLVFILLVFIVIIRTGIWYVPIASDVVYRMPHPLHEIDDVPYSMTLLTLHAEEAFRASSESKISIELSEEEITALVNDLGVGDSGITNIQFSVTPEYIEVYGMVPRTHPVIVRARVVPHIEENRLIYDIQSMHVGQVRIPQFLLSSDLLSRVTPSFLSSLQQTTVIENITLGEASITLVVHEL